MRLTLLSCDEDRPVLSHEFIVTTERGATMLGIRQHQVILVLGDETQAKAFRHKVMQGNARFDRRGKTYLQWNGVSMAFARPQYQALQAFVREEL